ncbi:MAG: EamA family transporter [Bifidobacteriaceae bacterium]|nr:EamA family transporter [Bifidobacteriaceae bacterium]
MAPDPETVQPAGGHRQRLRGVAAITLTAILWGTTGTAATFAPELGPAAIGSAAHGIGGLLQAAVAFKAIRRQWPRLAGRWRLVASGAACVVVYPLAFYASMRLAGVAVGTLVSLASAPLAAGLLERAIERRPITKRWLVSAGLGVAGCALVCWARASAASADRPLAQTLWGIALGLAAGATYAGYSWAARRLINSGISRAAVMGAVFGAGGALLIPVLVATGAPLLASPQAAAVAGYTVAVPMFLGYLMFGYGLVRVSASAATTITLIEPAVAALLAVAVVGERLPAVGWVGLGVIVLALAVLTWPAKRR